MKKYFRQGVRRAGLVVAITAMASLMVGARRSDGPCGMSPRRVEAPQQGIGGALRFAYSATSTHSLGRPLFFEAGNFERAPETAMFWYGDDHSRLVVLENALPVTGGRLSTGRWAEYKFGSQFSDGAVIPILPFPAATVRSVDIGLCSAEQPWTNPQGCGTADDMVRQLETINERVGLPFAPPIPGVGFCGEPGARITSRPGTARWSVEMGTPNGTPLGTQDLFCVEFGISLTTQLDCFATYGPLLLGCVYDGWTVRACGEFGTRLVDGVHRDPVFNLRSFESNPGEGRSNGARVCGFPADLTIAGGVVNDQIRSTLVGGINNGLQRAVTRRDLELPGDPIPGTCSSTLGPTARSNCARPAAGRTPNQECAFFLTGDPNSTAVRSSCEARRSGVSCTTNRDCGAGSGRRCEIVGRCLTDGFGSGPCFENADCQSGQCIITQSECVDSEPVCYWNVEVDRVETLPSGLQVVIAEDLADETAQVFQNRAVLGLLSRPDDNGNSVCRPGTALPFGGVSASGVLGPAMGAPIP
jgi:hypothetical protein